MKTIISFLCLIAAAVAAVSAPPEQARSERPEAIAQRAAIRQKTITRKAELKAQAEFMVLLEDLDEAKQSAAVNFLKTNPPGRVIGTNDCATLAKQVRSAGTNYTAAQWQAAAQFIRTNK